MSDWTRRVAESVLYGDAPGDVVVGLRGEVDSLRIALASANERAANESRIAEDMKTQRNNSNVRIMDVMSERDAAITRAEKAESDLVQMSEDLDEARRYACKISALVPRGGTLPLRYETARDVCLRLWPSDADRLFPQEVARG